MKNLVIIHLESISRQRLAAFASVMPHTARLLRESVTFDNFYSSATSTRMAVGYLFHGNDFEYDTSSVFRGMQPERNNPHLFSTLSHRGYNVSLLCHNTFQAAQPIRLRPWSGDLPPLWATDNQTALLERFDTLTDSAPFALYIWNVVTHIEHSLSLASSSTGLTDQIRRACVVADESIGRMRQILERKNLLDNTVIVVYGDHGDDAWTHGFKMGMMHGTEPYTDIIWAPLAFRDRDLAPTVVDRMASTIDIAPTCLSLLSVDAALSFPYSGVNLLQGASDFCYSQNFTANQPDNPETGVAKAFAITDQTYTLMTSSRGLELYAHRLDPGNHCNLLHFFSLDHTGRPILQARPVAALHFRSAWDYNPRAVESLADDFVRLRNALALRVAAKRSYIVERGATPGGTLDPACLASISQYGREAFFAHTSAPSPTNIAFPTLAFSFKLR